MSRSNDDNRLYRTEMFKKMYLESEKRGYLNGLSKLELVFFLAYMASIIEIRHQGSRQSVHSSGCAAPLFGRRFNAIAKLVGLNDSDIYELDIPQKPNRPDRPKDTTNVSYAAQQLGEIKLRAISLLKNKQAIAEIVSSTSYEQNNPILNPDSSHMTFVNFYVPTAPKDPNNPKDPEQQALHRRLQTLIEKVESIYYADRLNPTKPKQQQETADESQATDSFRSKL